MRIIRILLAIGAFVLINTSAWAAPANEESIEALLDAAKVRSSYDSIAGGLEEMMQQNLQQSGRGPNTSDEQRKLLDDMIPTFAAHLRKELSWEK